jgi:hypothetical protein
MITDALIGIAKSLLDLVIAALPAWSLAMPTDALDGLVGELSKWDHYAPITEVMSITGTLAVVVAALLAFRFVKWVFDSIVAVIP